VNFVKKSLLLRKISVVLVMSILVLVFNGCGGGQISAEDQVAEFHAAGPIQPEIDLEKLKAANITGTYRVVVGDIIELMMASALNVITADPSHTLELSIPTICRIHNDGTILVPVIGQIQAVGRTLAEIETSIVDAYYPEYSSQKPSVIARVLNYKTIKTSITGAVDEPGVYELQSDEKSLVSLIMKAGGIVDGGAAFIHIKRPPNSMSSGDPDSNNNDSLDQAPDAKGVSLSVQQDSLTGARTLLVRKDGALVCSEKLADTSEPVRQAIINKISAEYPDMPTNYIAFRLRKLSEVINPDSSGSTSRANGDATLTLPIKGLNIPFADVALQDGFSIVVEPLNQQVFSVVGLVRTSGVFPYPPGVQYNLLQALAFAGGVDEIADPRCVRVYRQKADGSLVDATFKLDGTSFVGAPTVMIRPGDVVAVEQTGRTHLNLMLAEIVSLSASAGTSASYIHHDGRDMRRAD